MTQDFDFTDPIKAKPYAGEPVALEGYVLLDRSGITLGLVYWAANARLFAEAPELAGVCAALLALVGPPRHRASPPGRAGAAGPGPNPRRMRRPKREGDCHV